MRRDRDSRSHKMKLKHFSETGEADAKVDCFAPTVAGHVKITVEIAVGLGAVQAKSEGAASRGKIRKEGYCAVPNNVWALVVARPGASEK